MILKVKLLTEIYDMQQFRNIYFELIQSQLINGIPPWDAIKDTHQGSWDIII